jgi:ribosome-dependent ATPase
MGEIYPATYYISISRGVFNKALGLADLRFAFAPMIAAAMVILGLSIMLLKKQGR